MNLGMAMHMNMDMLRRAIESSHPMGMPMHMNMDMLRRAIGSSHPVSLLFRFVSRAAARHLSCQVFGVWRTRHTGRCRRIDIVVNSIPEELALCRFTWIGSRLLNRLIRLHALKNGLSLTAHALLVTQVERPLVLKDRRSGQVERIPAEGQCVPVEVPYRYLRSESDLLYLLGGCTADFMALVDPKNRNA